MQVAKAIGCEESGLVSGLKSEKALQKEKNIRCIHYGNFVGESLKAAQRIGIRKVTLAIMIGKAVKLAEGHLDTHSHKVGMNKVFLKTLAEPQYAEAIDHITLARELWTFLPPSFFEKIKELCYQHCKRVFPEGELEVKLICENSLS
jgi:cobalt-precorrin-5B (C1)-methyltransferase